MSKVRTKKRNPQKTANRLVKAALRNSGVIFVTGGNGANIVNLVTTDQHAPTMLVAKAIEHLIAKWCVLCAVLMRDHNGNPYASYYLDYWNKTRTQSQIAKDAWTEHQRLLESCNRNHVVSVGWIAVPKLYDFTHESADAMFLKAGAWEGKAKWEISDEQRQTGS